MSKLIPPSVLIPMAASWAGDDLNQWGLMLALIAFSAIWITALGASVGSFLNVVIWRLPNGMSLIRPKSHCPKCGTPILPRDNLPVIGWLRLRGRCRTCREPISARYPLVEATTAMLFLGLAHFELFSGGANLPGGPPMPQGLTAVLWHARPEIIGVFVYHATLVALLLCVTLIVWDGYRPPGSLWILGIAIGLLLPIVLPMAHPVKSGLSQHDWPAWSFSTPYASIPIVPQELLNGLIGLGVGSVTGAILAVAVPPGLNAAADRRGVFLVCILGGLFLGWQASVACGLAAALLALINAIADRLTRASLPVTALIAVTLVVLVLLWRGLIMSEWVPGPAGWSVLRRANWPEAYFMLRSLAAAVAMTVLLAAVAALFTVRGSTPPSRD